MSTVYLNNEKGMALIFPIIAIAVIALAVLFGLISRSAYLTANASTYQAQNLQQELTQELQLIFTNQAICTAIVAVSGSTFKLGPPSQPLIAPTYPVQGFPNMTVHKMTLNPPAPSSGSAQSDFTIQFTVNNDESHILYNSTITGLYNVSGPGQLTSCNMVANAQTACNDLGMQWLTGSPGRCEVCESLGGTWNGSLCTGL